VITFIANYGVIKADRSNQMPPIPIIATISPIRRKVELGKRAIIAMVRRMASGNAA